MSRNNMQRRKNVQRRYMLAAALGLFATGITHGQLRIATWNVTGYSGGRADDIRTVVYGIFQDRSMAPDAIAGQEFMSWDAALEFVGYLNDAPGSPGDWWLKWVGGSPEGNVLFYRESKLAYISYAIGSSAGPRNVIRYKLRPVGYSSNEAALWIYNAHLKAGDTSSDKQTREAECQELRENAAGLNASWHYILAGDLNIPSSYRSSYQYLVGDTTSPGHFTDPISTPGAWQNNCSYRFVHTQDPIGPGGMDDRYDQLLVSDSLVDGSGLDYIGTPWVPYSTTTWNDAWHSYRAWGNDGTSCNSTLTTTGNTMVGPEIAQSIRDCAAGAGHIPVYFDLRVPAVVGSDEVINFGEVPQGTTAETLLAVWNAGDVSLWTAAGIATLHYELSTSTGFTAPAGGFEEGPGGAVNQHTIVMDTSTPGPKSGVLTITSDAPDEPTRSVTLVGEVTPPLCAGDVDCSGLVDYADIDVFVEALNHPGGAGWPYDCPWLSADCNSDGDVTYADIDAFVGRIGAVCP